MDSGDTTKQALDFGSFGQACRRGRGLIIAVTCLAFLVAVIYAFIAEDVYRAEVVAAPTEEAQGAGLGQLAGQLGGLASLAGMSMGQGQIDKSVQALEILQSRQFLSDFIAKYNIAVPLMAAIAWHPETNELVLDEAIYSSSSQQWTRDPRGHLGTEPTAWEMTEVFRERILQVEQDQRTGVIRLGVEFYSPVVAQQWASALLAELNEVMRARDVSEAEQSIAFLEERQSQTKLASMHQVFAQLIEKQMQTMMLANARHEYIFTTLDPAVVPETPVKPKRAVIIIVATLLGLILGLALALLKSTVLAVKK